MLKRLIIIVALINPCIVSVAYAANDSIDKFNNNEQFAAYTSNESSQQSSLYVKNSTTGLHGRYILTPSRCYVCHGFDKRADGTTKSIWNVKDGACDWCHASGAASSYYIAMDNDENTGVEFSTGHSRGFGLANGKWRAPDDTYPAFTPRFWHGGMTCFDCHAAHANPARTLGHNANGEPSHGILDGGFNDIRTSLISSVYEPGHWILKKNPDREHIQATGDEIDDTYDGALSDRVKFAVNKIAIDWDNPLIKNPTGTKLPGVSGEYVNAVSETCIDCHDGNGGLHTIPGLAYSPEEGAAGKIGIKSYDVSHSHDSQPGRCGGKMNLNTEDNTNDGPDCRSCHRGGGDCDLCHASGRAKPIQWPRDAYAIAPGINDENEQVDESASDEQIRVFGRNNSNPKSLAGWDPDFKNMSIECSPQCANLGFSWPHKTFAWKMLKNELYGAYFDDRNAEITQIRQLLVKYSSIAQQPAHDLIGAVCLDCHNPTAWQPDETEPMVKGLP